MKQTKAPNYLPSTHPGGWGRRKPRQKCSVREPRRERVTVRGNHYKIPKDMSFILGQWCGLSGVLVTQVNSSVWLCRGVGVAEAITCHLEPCSLGSGHTAALSSLPAFPTVSGHVTMWPAQPMVWEQKWWGVTARSGPRKPPPFLLGLHERGEQTKVLGPRPARSWFP